MSVVKVSELVEVVKLNPNDTFPVVNNGETRKAKIQQILDMVTTSSNLEIKIVDSTDEVVKENIIYLVPNTNPKDKNTYDEYMLIEGEPEKIGSTDIDLTDYYTKEETDNIINNSVEKIVYNVEISWDISTTTYIFNDEDKSKLSDVFTDIFKKGLSTCIINFITPLNTNINLMYQPEIPILLFTDIQKKPFAIYGSYSMKSKSNINLHVSVNNWDNDICSITGTSLIIDTLPEYATTSYVDDAIRGALNGSY